MAEDEEARLLTAAPPLLTTALDTGTRQGEMLALRFGAIDFARGLITPRGETKSKTQKQALSHADHDLTGWLGVRDDFRNWSVQSAA
jgi:integrase